MAHKIPTIIVNSVADGQVRLVGNEIETVIQNKQRAKFSHLEPGNYTVYCVHADYSFKPKKVSLGGKEHMVTDCDGYRTGYTKVGRTSLPNILLLFETENTILHTVSDHTGNYQISGLSPSS